MSSIPLFVFYNPNRQKSRQGVAKLKKHWPQVIEITEIQKLAALQGQHLVVAGGDGTFHAAVNNSSHSNTFWFYACGTGNDFVINFDALRLEDLELAISNNSLHTIGLMRFNSKYGLNSAGFLFQGQVAKTASTMWRGWGNLIYIFAAARHLFTYKPQALELNEQKTKLLMLSFGNGQCTGGGYHLFPTVHPSKFGFARLAIGSIGLKGRLLYAVRARHGKHLGMPGVQYTECTQTTLKFKNSPLMDIDGEIYTMPRLVNVEYIPNVLKMAVIK